MKIDQATRTRSKKGMVCWLWRQENPTRNRNLRAKWDRARFDEWNAYQRQRLAERKISDPEWYAEYRIRERERHRLYRLKRAALALSRKDETNG